MDDSVFAKDPPRLIEQDGVVGQLLKSAEPAFQGALLAGPSWRRLEDRLQGARRRRQWVLPLSLGFAAAAVFAFAALRPRTTATPISLLAEPSAPSAPAATSATPVPAAPIPATEPGHRPIFSNSAARHGAAADEAASSDTSCRALTESKPERAVDCFLSLASGSGVQAEVALYEALRLSAGELHNPARALELSEQYRSRFPDGAMRGEVAWLRVQSLNRAGRSDDALSESEALLGTPLGRALSPKLHLLRGHIYVSERGDCASAISEYVSLVGAPGADADAAELERASCLERLAQLGDARAAYQQYLKRPDARDPARATSRLEALASSNTESAGTP
jgi:hypothetical protein